MEISSSVIETVTGEAADTLLVLWVWCTVNKSQHYLINKKHGIGARENESAPAPLAIFQNMSVCEKLRDRSLMTRGMLTLIYNSCWSWPVYTECDWQPIKILVRCHTSQPREITGRPWNSRKICGEEKEERKEWGEKKEKGKRKGEKRRINT